MGLDEGMVNGKGKEKRKKEKKAGIQRTVGARRATVWSVTYRKVTLEKTESSGKTEITMFHLRLPALLLLSPIALAQNETTQYDYIAVGSGPGGAPLASRLARAGQSVLLIEAGDDEANNPNMWNMANFNEASNDPTSRWNFFVRQFSDPALDDQRHQRSEPGERPGSWSIRPADPRGPSG